MADRHSPQAPPAKRARFSLEPDIEVVVEDTIFKVHSFVLMSQSPVFHRMLTSQLREAEEGRVSLPGKKKDEFQEFLRQLATPGSSAPPEVKPETAMWLMHWADEYEVDGLRARCEEAVMELPAGSFEALEFATKFRLENRRQQCLIEIARDIYPHRARLLELLDHRAFEPGDEASEDEGAPGEVAPAQTIAAHEAVVDNTNDVSEEKGGADEGEHALFLALILPQLFAAVGLERPKQEFYDDKPDCLTIDHLWPIVVRALEIADGWRDLQEIRAAAKRALVTEKAIQKFLPRGPIGKLIPGERGMTLQQIHVRLNQQTQGQRSILEVNDVMEAMVRAKLAQRRPNGSFTTDYSFRHDDHTVRLRPGFGPSGERPERVDEAV